MEGGEKAAAFDAARRPKRALRCFSDSFVSDGRYGYSDYKGSHMITMNGDQWPDGMRLSDLEPQLAYSACGKRGADARRGRFFAAARDRSPTPPRAFGFRTLRVVFGFGVGGLAITRVAQLLLELRLFIDCHRRLVTLGRHNSYREIRTLSPRIRNRDLYE
jgi:hypothetical protein